MTRSEAFDRLRRVRDEWHAGTFAVARALAVWDDDPDLSEAARREGVTADELRRCVDSLEVTFVLRLFAEFEGILRDYWRRGLGRSTEPIMRQLMDGVARRRGANEDDLALAHQIRDYRNDIIHERLLEARFDLPQCRNALARYLRWLPLQW